MGNRTGHGTSLAEMGIDIPMEEEKEIDPRSDLKILCYRIFVQTTRNGVLLENIRDYLMLNLSSPKSVQSKKKAVKRGKKKK